MPVRTEDGFTRGHRLVGDDSALTARHKPHGGIPRRGNKLNRRKKQCSKDHGIPFSLLHYYITKNENLRLSTNRSGFLGVAVLGNATREVKFANVDLVHRERLRGLPAAGQSAGSVPTQFFPRFRLPAEGMAV